jgi:acyl-CoA thioester hydrolase
MTENKEYTHAIEFGVRDYECDIQGVVNNANYQHYLEHARHEFLISRDISFSALHNEGIDLIVSRIEINYKYPLRSHDKFVVKSVIQKEGNVKLVFIQDIYRQPDEKLIVQAKVTCAAVKNGKPIRPEAIFEKLKLT